MDRWWARWSTRASFVILAAVCVGGLLVVQHQANENRRLVGQIQAGRLESCRQTNDRHDDALHQLDVILAKALRDADPAARKALKPRLDASRASTGALINALVPKRDCPKFIQPPRASDT